MNNRSFEILPAIMPNSAEHLDTEAQRVSAFALTVQIDVMDGKFVPPISWPYGSGQMKELERVDMIPSAAQFFYEAHLMVQDPTDMGVMLARRGVRRIIGHVEAMGHSNDALRILNTWRAEGAEVGVSLLLGTPLAEITATIAYVDVVQVMSIAEIGYQGHAFDSRAIERVAQLRALYPDLVIAVDGGVSVANARALVEAGANRLGVGSAIMKAEDPEVAYRAIIETI